MPRRYLQKIIPDPASLRELWFLRPFAQRLTDPQLWCLHRRGVTYAFGAGLAICFIPLPVHLGTACAVALLWRLNLPVICGTTFLLNPFTAVPVYYVAYRVGCGAAAAPPDSAFTSSPTGTGSPTDWRRYGSRFCSAAWYAPSSAEYSAGSPWRSCGAGRS